MYIHKYKPYYIHTFTNSFIHHCVGEADPELSMLCHLALNAPFFLSLSSEYWDYLLTGTTNSGSQNSLT